jgi:hypothetical protein
MKKKFILPLLFLVQIIIINILSFFPQFIEDYYSNGLYPYISKASRIIFGIVGFSIGDIIYGIVILFIIRWIWKTRKTWQSQWKTNLLTIVSFMSVFYFLFQMLWGLNYLRLPLNEKLSIEKKYTQEELVAFTKRMIEKANAVHFQITKDTADMVVIPYSVEQIYQDSPVGYRCLAYNYREFAYNCPSIKSSLISTPLSYMGFGGYLNPFTNEAQVNDKLPLYNLPTTTCHEMSHQIGYASESEANFIGYMASIHNKDIYYQYSGYSFALKYCLRNIARLDEKQAESLLPLINPGIRKNFKESEEFNEKYSSFVEVIFEVFYDNFLKANKQEDGLEGYSKFVGLLVNYYENKEL